MNIKITKGKFNGTKKTYYSNNRYTFWFNFVDRGKFFDIYCTKRPSFNGKSKSVSKTHLYSSGKICFVAGKSPRTYWEAESRAKEWAEYFVEYRKTGRSRS